MDIKNCSCWKRVFWVVLVLAVLAMVGGALARIYQFWDKDPDRGATTVKNDVFGDSFTQVKYLDQGWKPADSLWFYNTTQGSNMLPYDFFLALEQVDKQVPFRDNENMNRYRYLPQKPTFSNPDGLPVGFVKDTYKGKAFMGFTCAACHTGQVNYKGTAMRIDGGPADADMYTFIIDLANAMTWAQDNEEARKRFVKNVQSYGNYRSEEEILADLKKYTQRINAYMVINRSPTKYGYARLDAFGRIYNRVLEHTMNEDKLRSLLRVELSPEDLEIAFKDVENVLSGEQRDHLLYRVTEKLSVKDQLKLRNRIFNPPDAPVSYPFLWDIPQHDYVQWNGLASNGGVGPVGRNAGEVIGVFGTLDWKEEEGFSLSAFIGGQGIGKHVSYDSSVNVRNLRRIETHLSSLMSPQWPEDILPPIDKKGVLRGAKLFDKYCVSCHAEIRRDDPQRRIVANLTRLADIKTDPKMATNAVTYMGFSGIARNGYVDTDVGSILLNERAPAAAILTKATMNVVATPDPDQWFFQRWAEWLYDLATAFFHNDIKPSIKFGGYDPDTTANAYSSLKAYKSRSLNGIWATAPYLHNGSVPTLYDLLLPACPQGKASSSECRPNKFQVGSREFDPVKVGIVSSGYDGFTFDTAVRGNSNAGHDYGVVLRQDENGKDLPPLTKEQRMDLVEYMKSL